MSLCSRIALTVSTLAFAAALCAPLEAQDNSIDLSSSYKIDLPADAPLSLISMNMGDSRASSRGGAIVLDLHMSLTLRNSGSRHVRGVTLLITAQEFAPGGKGSVTRPSIDVLPGENFTLPVDIRLVRPVRETTGPLVRVQLDGVLFDDLSFYGPNKLDSQRALTFWEAEAQRDLAYFKQVLQAKGQNGLQSAMLASLSKGPERGQLNVSVSRNGRAVGSVVAVTEHAEQFAVLSLPDAPVEPLEGWAAISGNEARSPQIEVLNTSGKPVRYVEIGWLVKDKTGNQFLAGTVPASDTAMVLPAGQRARLQQDTVLKFSRSGRPVEIDGMTAYVNQVQFADGHVWVPSRHDLDSSPLLRVTAPSPEEQRLTDIYQRKGLAALVADLNRY